MTSPEAGFVTQRLIGVRAGDDLTAELQGVLEAAGDAFAAVTGRAEPPPDAAEREIAAAASTPGRSLLLLRDAGGAAVGALGWWAHHPEPDMALLGMLVLVPDRRGEGLEREAIDALSALLGRAGVGRLRTAVVGHDPERRAWFEDLGFQPAEQRAHIDVDRGRVALEFLDLPIGG